MRTRSPLASVLALAAVASLAACAEPPADPPPGTSLAAFESADRASAKLDYQSKTDAEKVALWREHFARETAATRFPAAQAAIIADTVAALPSLVTTFDATLAARAEAAFSTDQLAVLFELPGRWPGDAIHQRAALAADSCDTRWCLCGLPPQPPGLVCNGAHCSSTSSGCGWFGQQSCTRECYIDDSYE